MSATFGLTVAGIGGLIAWYNPANLRLLGIVSIPVGLVMVFIDRS
jgi:hypothetical protein|tara:strand:+ start:285 stop:419 length:135 start_codon:yes stop_codon:yes gene_type:complete